MHKRKRAPGKRPKPALAFVCALALLIAAARGLSVLSGGAAGAAPSPSPSAKIKVVLERADVDENVDPEVLIELIGIERREEREAEPGGLAGEGPRVLIYHTHTTEAYFPTEAYQYSPGTGWRCADNSMNIVAVGERLAEALRSKYGMNVLHDTTDHEPPKLSSAYSRSCDTMLAYKEKYPSITLFIDLHRDSYGEPEEPQDFITLNGREVARIMFVVGTGKGATGTGFDEMPDFAANYALALSLTEYLAGIDPQLPRNIRVKTGRYNQHVAPSCILAEIGHNANTFEQALAAADHLADAIAHVYGHSSQGNEPDILQLTPQ